MATATPAVVTPPPEDSAAVDANGNAQPDSEPEDGEKAKLERMAEALLGGSVGWHAGKKAFVVVTTYNEEGVDLTQIRRALALTPLERLIQAEQAAAEIKALQRLARVKSDRGGER